MIERMKTDQSLVAMNELFSALLGDRGGATQRFSPLSDFMLMYGHAGAARLTNRIDIRPPSARSQRLYNHSTAID
jgi:hypothetical protein